MERILKKVIEIGTVSVLKDATLFYNIMEDIAPDKTDFIIWLKKNYGANKLNDIYEEYYQNSDCLEGYINRIVDEYSDHYNTYPLPVDSKTDAKKSNYSKEFEYYHDSKKSSLLSKDYSDVTLDLRGDNKTEQINYPNDARQFLGISFGWDRISITFPSSQGIIPIPLHNNELTEPAIFSLTESGKLLFIYDAESYRERNHDAPICYLGQLIKDDTISIVYGKHWMSAHEIIKKYCQYLRLKVNQLFGQLTGTCVISFPSKDLIVWRKWKDYLTEAGFYVKKIMYQSAAVCLYDLWNNSTHNMDEIIYCTIDGNYIELNAPIIKEGYLKCNIVSDYYLEKENLKDCFIRLNNQLIKLCELNHHRIKKYCIVLNNHKINQIDILMKSIKGQVSTYNILCEQVSKGCSVEGGVLQTLAKYKNILFSESLSYDIGIKYTGEDSASQQYLILFKKMSSIPATVEKEIYLKDYLNQIKRMEFYYSRDLNSNSFPQMILGDSYIYNGKTIDSQKVKVRIRFSINNNMELTYRIIDAFPTKSEGNEHQVNKGSKQKKQHSNNNQTSKNQIKRNVNSIKPISGKIVTLLWLISLTLVMSIYYGMSSYCNYYLLRISEDYKMIIRFFGPAFILIVIIITIKYFRQKK